MGGFSSKFSFGETKYFSNDVAFVQIAVNCYNENQRLRLVFLITLQSSKGSFGLLKSLAV